MSLGTENKERALLDEVQNSLQKASQLSYNSASHIYEIAGLVPDPRMGGTCLNKLSKLKDSLPDSLKEKFRIVTSLVGDTTHYAMLVDLNGITFYLDPFLWQNEPMAITGNNPDNTVGTLANVFSLNRERDEEGSIFVITLREANQQQDEQSKVLVTHRFTTELSSLPSSSAIALKPDLATFGMQIPDRDNQKMYKIYYLKQNNHLGDIWVMDGNTGEKTKLPTSKSGKRTELRAQAIKDIERLLGASEQELCQYFAKAHELELQLYELMKNAANDEPTTHVELV